MGCSQSSPIDIVDTVSENKDLGGESLDQPKSGQIDHRQHSVDYVENEKFGANGQAVIADGPTEENHDELAKTDDQDVLKIFKEFDANGDEIITISEFQNGMKTLGRPVSIEETKALFKLVNPEGDGETINYGCVPVMN